MLFPLLLLLLLFLSVGAGLAYALSLFYLEPRRYMRFMADQGIPSVSTLPSDLLGRQSMARRKQARADDEPFRVLQDDMAAHGRVFVTMFGPYARLMVAEPEILKQVLAAKPRFERRAAEVVDVSLYNRNPLTSVILGPLLGDGLLITDGVKHRQHRKMINPAFHFANLKAFVPLMARVARERMDRLEWTGERAKEVQMDMTSAFSDLTLDLIAATAFGAPFFEDDSVRKVVAYSFTQLLTSTMQRIFSLEGLIPIVRDLPLASKRLVDDGRRQLQSVVLKIIQDRREGRTSSMADGPDLLDLLLASKDADTGVSLSETEVMDQIRTFILAGHETTSLMLSWTAMLLCQHPEWMARCRDEVDRVFEHGKRPITYDALKELTEQDLVFRESLRLYPPAAFITRRINRDHTVDWSGSPTGKLHMPAGLVVAIPVREIHRLEPEWEQPLLFNPERFRDTRPAPCTWLPFAEGHRSCIGRNFAMLEAKVLLSLLLQHVTLDLLPDQKIVEDISITMRPKYGLHMRVTPRRPS